jgi:hypothetical protein
MRVLAIIMLTLFQFTALPFLSIVAGNTERHAAVVEQNVTENMTTIYKSASM